MKSLNPLVMGLCFYLIDEAHLVSPNEVLIS